MLTTSSLQDALSELDFTPEIDLFASRMNTQFPKYVSFKPDPSAFAMDAFTLDWSNIMFYAFPPFSVIPAVLSKIVAEKATGVCILPDWPTQGRYPKATQMLMKERVILKARKYLRGDSPSVAQAQPYGLPLIRDSLDLSLSAKEVLMGSWRTGTTKQYQTYLTKWLSYCNEYAVDVFRSGVNQGVEFLVTLFRTGLDYSAVNTARSALSSIVTLNDGTKFGEHPLVCRCLKGIYELRPALPKYTQIWDINIVLHFLKTFDFACKLSLKDLSLKLTVDKPYILWM